MKTDLNQTAPMVSIVIPAYNCQSFIALTVRSIQSQTLKEWECIIIDDGSSDGTLALIRELAAADARIRTATQANGGPASARNHGLSLISSGSEYVAFMDSDDIWLPDALEVLKAEIEKHPGAAGAHGMGRCIDKYGAEYLDPAYAANGNGRFICDSAGREILLDPDTPTTFQSLWFSNPYPPGLILTRRAVYEKTGTFDGSVCPMEDWDMVIRLSRHGHFRFVRKVLLSYRRHDNNLSGQSASIHGRQIRLIHHKTYFSTENDPAQRRIARENCRATELLHLRQKARAGRERFAKGDIGGILSAIAGGCVHLCRYARGYPTRERFEGFRRTTSSVRSATPSPVVSHNPT
jgi:glycosyltransferase involved in cell wall biosynthesis